MMYLRLVNWCLVILTGALLDSFGVWQQGRLGPDSRVVLAKEFLRASGQRIGQQMIEKLLIHQRNNRQHCHHRYQR